MTKLQETLVNKLKQKIDFARSHTLEEWAIYEEYGVTEYESTIIVKRFNDYGFKTKEDAINHVKDGCNDYERRYSKSYENCKNGICLCRENSNTLKSLENQGIIEIIEDGKTWIDKVKLLNY